MCFFFCDGQFFIMVLRRRSLWVILFWGLFVFLRLLVVTSDMGPSQLPLALANFGLFLIGSWFDFVFVFDLGWFHFG